ncbi:MAG: hypothetical protein JNM44_02815, partial [Chitinophagaceae bacterium]|nr:hypothetical protein [Chitinophagaceae bacterium]
MKYLNKILGLIFGLFLSQTSYAIYIPVTMTGYNADVVADVAGNAMGSTNNDVDGVNYVFMSQSYNPGGSFMPLGGLVNSVVATTPGLTFQLEPYTANNSLRIGSGGSGTLTLTSPISAEEIFVLGTTGSGSSTTTITVTFTDGTTQVFTGISFPDWFGGTGFAIQGMGRTNRTTNTIANSTTDPRLYQRQLTLLPANYSKLVQSLSFSTTGGVLNIMAATLFNNIPCTGVPNAGNAQASPLNPCPGVSVQLNLTGNTVAGNLAYQWWRSFTGCNGPWVPVPGGNTAVISYTPPPGATIYFMCVVTCLSSGLVDTATCVGPVTVQPFSPTSPCYCTSAATNTADEEITNVTLGSMNNTTTCQSLTGTACTGTGTASLYSNFTSCTPYPILYKGLAHTANLTVGSCGTTNFVNAFKIYIDYNQNTVFELSEEVYFSGTTGLSCVPPTTVNATFTVPITALSGPTRMRVINQEGGQSSATTIVPCGTYGYGETEDYVVNIIQPSPYDPAVSSINVPTGSCFSATETVTVNVTNYGSNTINLTTNPVTCTLKVNGPLGLVTYTGTLSTGTLN